MGSAEYQCTSARNLLANGQLSEAVSVIRKLLDGFPDCADGWLVLSEIQAAAGNMRPALSACDRAIALAPERAEMLAQYCRCALAMGTPDEKSLSYALRLTSMPLNNAGQLNDLGRFLTAAGCHEQAEAQYRRAIVLQPKEPGFHYNLATAQRFLGKVDEAENSLRRVLELNPQDSDAYLLLSGLQRQSTERNELSAMQALLNTENLTVRERINFQFATAKSLEDLEHWDESFSNLQAGARLRRDSMRYDVRGDLAVLDALQTHFNSEFFSTLDSGCASSEPIFILGMPRTGSTLLERILASHTQVQSAGELNNFALQLVDLASKTSATKGVRLSKLQLIEASRNIDFNFLGERYIASTRLQTGRKPHFIDKLPFNYLYIGLIHAALPNAKIIHMQRDPMDTCYAMYKQLFESAYPFSYDLKELSQYYLAYRQLMDHWNRVLPDRICHVRYEDLVENTESTVRRVFSYCGLEWQEQCLDFQANREASTTASAVQVRQPVYRSSIGKWKNYKEHLGPLLKIFRECGVEHQ